MFLFQEHLYSRVDFLDIDVTKAEDKILAFINTLILGQYIRLNYNFIQTCLPLAWRVLGCL